MDDNVADNARRISMLEWNLEKAQEEIEDLRKGLEDYKVVTKTLLDRVQFQLQQLKEMQDHAVAKIIIYFNINWYYYFFIRKIC